MTSNFTECRYYRTFKVVLGRYTEKIEPISDILRYQYRRLYIYNTEKYRIPTIKYQKSVHYFRYLPSRCTRAFYAHKYMVND